MTDKAAIYGNYADLKYIKTRSVVQVVVEVPIERANEVTDAFGWPMPGEEIPLALARLAPVAVQEKSKRKFEDLPPSQQAGILCEKIEFRNWIADKYPVTGMVGSSADFVRDFCEVESRAELNGDPHAERWHKLYAQYLADTGRTAEQR